MEDNGSKANKKRHYKCKRHVIEDTFTHPKVIESLFMVNNKVIRYKYYCMRHIRTCADKIVRWLMIYFDNEHLKNFNKYFLWDRTKFTCNLSIYV